MQSRIPLSIVFSADGKRHAIPHCTFRVPVCQATDAAQTDQEEEGVSFFHYLDSNDTRLPSHPHLSAYAQPPEEYETYVGEEVWEREAADKKKASAPPQTSSTQETAVSDGEVEALEPVPGFHSVVNWVRRVFAEEDWAGDGVVLCGRYVVADDGAWVVPSRSPTLFSTREVFLLMRNSCKFLQDVHAQMNAMKAAASGPPHCPGSPSLLYLEFSLARSLAGSGASEMRAILPYPLHFSTKTQTWVTDDTAASLSFTGIGQRLTDVCFPSLMAWTEDEHDENFRRMQRRIEQAALLERTREVDPDFISRLVARFLKRRGAASSQSVGCSSAGHGVQHPAEHLTLLLTIDLLFDGPSLPIYVLSAKSRVFEVVQRTEAVWDELLGTTAVWPLWAPLLKSAAGEAGGSQGSTSAATLSTMEGTSTNSDTDAQEEADTEEDDEDEVESGNGAATLNFFRMFRDAAHWNQYVVTMTQRLHAAAADSSSSPDSNKPFRDVQHYCVIASESSDLVTCGDTLTKRGLPLELMHPELLELNADAAGFLKMLRDGLFKRPNGEN
ncbi:hypothetical protein ABB37_01588 [Leptomonas pyrrhocoris]|uniref:Uncharacterized protein n=1 Tax=Leptomonas pyrrhocoris TaxID=157538 RepID=A0A0N0DZF3_LEPPY|nr:hypothetical protein ABB37_01588 [Leptomonas pyrrhocoris]XP_015663675.1 hypothetical protein ABB37_01588 [Leptomonas pyrrhocoris]KPA85235.1 hypothetical protein ABB37_01588 [Leptomonas pyrrhocoris]KPA85236.1 hypothetical protein ABB37_01588 [Leptomonas pyrrhocoris]|eukprot:XP_015663674.1 hypothetical protein ABB37_01588 [Leptomonas pyrrhocoris]